MLAATVIVLREILEICLIVGVVSAALNNVKHKKGMLLAGIAGGVICSIILALTLQKISNSFDGNGQEFLNIAILTASILCIGFTVLWINTQSKALHKRITDAHQKLIEKQINIIPVILVITLAISREGAELTLFLHGISAAGTYRTDLILGIILGSFFGVGLGSLLYWKLLNISPKYFFKTINVMLILLAAGMASQLANYISSADIISRFSRTLWDSSWLISEESIIGKLLHGLVGYSSRPTGLQLIFYSLTIIIFSLALFRKKKKTS